jgi:pimeloyl-ACP methyl ester carboxylesterase
MRYHISYGCSPDDAGFVSGMKKTVLMVFIIGMFVSGFASTSYCKTVVFFIGGWGMTQEQMESFSRSVPDSRKVTYRLPAALSELVRPWHCADLVYEYIRKNDMLEDNLIFVSFSLGGTVTQWLLSNHPELHTKKVILVGSPVGGYKFIPPNNFFSNDFPQDLPIYVIAGNKGQDAWFLRNENDGVVDLESALDIPDRNLRDAAIFHADHNDLEEMPEVQAQISKWLNLDQEPDTNIMAENNTTSRTSTDSTRFSPSHETSSN